MPYPRYYLRVHWWFNLIYIHHAQLTFNVEFEMSAQHSPMSHRSYDKVVPESAKDQK